MRAIIFYFSGTGNTWFIAKELKKQLKKHKYDAVCYSVENIELTETKIKQLVESSDRIILGYPTYASDLPMPMRDFISKLPKLSVLKNISAFCTQSMASGDGVIFLTDVLKSKGYELKQAAHFKMSNNFYTPLLKLFPAGDYQKISKRNNKALIKVKDFACKIVNNEELLTGNNFWGHLIGNTQRKHYQATIKKFNDAMLVNDKCTQCNLCVNNCPVKNIKEVGNKVQIGKQCCLCMRCYNFCPTSAINITNKSENTAKYPRFKGPIKSFNLSELKK